MLKIFYSLIFVLFATVSSGQAYIDPKLRAIDGLSQVPVILVFHSPNISAPNQWTKQAKGHFVYQNLIHHRDQAQSEIKEYLRTNKIGFQSFYIINALATKLTIDQINKLQSYEGLKAILWDRDMFQANYIHEKQQIESRVIEPEWGIVKIGADRVWAKGITGKNVVIGGLDTGFEWYHDVLRTKYRGYIDDSTSIHEYHWHDAIHTNSPQWPDTLMNPCGFSTKVPCDDQNHGTHTMGTMIGSDSTNLIGVAPDARWVACRNMDRGWGRPSSYLECFEWMLAPRDTSYANPKTELAPDVINNSWYCADAEGCDDVNRFLFDDAIKNLKAAGIFVVVSAGNSGSKGCGSISETPALFKSSFSVGATDINDDIAGFSSRGPSMIDSIIYLKPNVSAPGVSVRSIIKNGSFANFSGTSMAGPHVAGAVALIISANPSLRGNVQVIEDILSATAVPLVSSIDCDTFKGANIPNAVFGYGRINVFDAVERAIALSTTTNVSQKNLRVYPNPAQDILNIDGHGHMISDINITSLDGKLLWSYNYAYGKYAISIPIQTLEPGVYILSIGTDKDRMTQKVVKL
jgi:hypothetical protein